MDMQGHTTNIEKGVIDLKKKLNFCTETVLAVQSNKVLHQQNCSIMSVL